ncbi:PD-(D/E)XK nuclease-like domain-containing protein [Streptosporangium saharense]|uniref:PD-(D/E)XK nuclease-like domain-containing protein n=1 Tax=Streptosporangium saharense TaxID=1706840 RepID=UPI003323BA91
MTATLPDVDGLIADPGVYDIPEHLYHADPVLGRSLSSTGARRLLPPNCPAIFRHEQLNPPAPKKVWDIGTAAHKLVLGSGPDLVRIDADEWRTTKVKEEVAEVRARGAVPLKPAEHDQVHAMADAIRAHRVAGALFDPTYGRPEQTLVWQDDQTGVWCRARLDWLPNPHGGRLIIPDYKTCRSAAPADIQRAVFDHGYHQQDAWYRAGTRALGLADETAAFVFVFQEKTAPYLVTVVQLDENAQRIAEDRNRRALEIYHDCVEADRWPGYSDDITLITPPAWAEYRHAEELS